MLREVRMVRVHEVLQECNMYFMFILGLYASLVLCQFDKRIFRNSVINKLNSPFLLCSFNFYLRVNRINLVWKSI